MCVGCRARAGKAALVRIVSSGPGPVLDRDGSAPGRGAYVHPDPSCLVAARRPGVLARALRTGVRLEEVGRLMLEIERMGAA